MGFEAPGETDLMTDHLEQVVNKTWNKWGRAKTTRDEIFNAVLGLTGEAGEVADLFKKGFFHRPQDEAEQEQWQHNLCLELGDVAYYWLKLLDLFHFSVEEVLEANREKLFERHQVEVKSEATTD